MLPFKVNNPCQIPKASHLNNDKHELDPSYLIPVRIPLHAVGHGICLCCGEEGGIVCKVLYICVT